VLSKEVSDDGARFRKANLAHNGAANVDVRHVAVGGEAVLDEALMRLAGLAASRMRER